MTIPSITLNDGKRIPQLGFGVWQVSTDDIVPAVSAALETGYRHLDTAAIYGNEAGVGRAIADSGIARNDLFVTTKLWNTRHRDARAALEQSLERLGLDHVDLYLIHWPTPDDGDRFAAWEALQEARRDGLAASVGVSNFLPNFLDELVERSGAVPAVNQVELHPTFQQREVQATDDRHGVTTEAYSPLGTGADLADPVIAGIAERLGVSPAQVILRWQLQAGRIVIPKSITPARIAENFAVTDFALGSADIAAIDGLDSGNRVNADPAVFNAL